MSSPAPTPLASAALARPRMVYLDWLRVIAMLGVFLVHVSGVFNTVLFEIKNPEQSEVITIIQGFMFPWGMPLFFFVSGAGSFFALRHRSPGQFTRERTLRLLVPWFTGTLLLGPVQLYLSWRHRLATGVTTQTLAQFVAERFAQPGPKWFGAIGYHMWFLGFLFAFSLLALPLLAWLRSPAGQRAVAGLAGFCRRRGAILVFILPLMLLRLVLQPLFPIQHDWADFFVYGLFFVLGYLMLADERFLAAVRRDWAILLATVLVTTLGFGILILGTEGFGMEERPDAPAEFLIWALVSAAGWAGTAFMLFLGMRFMNRGGRALRYGLEVLLPFFVIHQPVIIVISYFVVQWKWALLPKLLLVLVSSFAITLALCEWIVRRAPVLRMLFGMKADASGLPVAR